jgi:hypothetical protein
MVTVAGRAMRMWPSSSISPSITMTAPSSVPDMARRHCKGSLYAGPFVEVEVEVVSTSVCNRMTV